VKTLGLLGLLALAGCATLLEGSEQSIRFVSTPAGASVRVLGRFGETPATILVPKKPPQGDPASGTPPPIDVYISKPGYEEAHIVLGYAVSGISQWGNIANLGIGWPIDRSTGARYYIETPDHTGYLTTVNVVLQPKPAASE
jgi:hypothetical protein